VWPRRTPADSEIDFGVDAAAVERLVRAVSQPYPYAWFRIGNAVVQVVQASIVEETTSERPGTILGFGPSGAPRVACTDGVVELATRAPVPRSFTIGTRITSGQVNKMV
jgi:UDP-4-amino-4-deoxy-L-arabinose formyltransferase/UDP-glucuronic acid dehydrogenase (UDP-4-keto-hexauronic acid decarboxylating)